MAPPSPRFDIKLHRRNTPREALLQDLRRVARQSGERSPTTRIYDRHGLLGAQALIRRFGSWNEALAAAGLPVDRPSSISDSDLHENLARLWRKLGRQPVALDMVRKQGQSRYSAAAYCVRFGSWNKALQAFDAFANRGRKPRPPIARARRKPQRDPRKRRISWRLRATVLLRDNCACRMCGASPAKDPAVSLHVDHIKPWAKGGTTSLPNLQTLCSACNIGKSDRTCAPPRRKTSKRCGAARPSLRARRTR